MNDKRFMFLLGMATAVTLTLCSYYLTDTLLSQKNLHVPEDAVVVLRSDGTQCVGYVAAKPNFIGAPPRLWVCPNETPRYDATGMEFP